MVLTDRMIEIEMALSPLDDCNLKCEWLTQLSSFVLRKHNVPHSVHYGYVRHEPSKMCVTPHCWIEMDNRIIDFRLRSWLGDDDAIPHGVFLGREYPAVTYEKTGTTCDLFDGIGSLSEIELDELSDERLRISLAKMREVRYGAA